MSLTRRQTLSGAAAAGVGAPLLAACGSDESSTASDPSSEPAAAGTELGPTSEVPKGGGKIFTEDRVVVTQPSAGEFKAFDSTCPHQGCQVSQVTETIDCKCHGSAFSLTDGSVVSGPSPKGLTPVDVTVDGDTLTLS